MVQWIKSPADAPCEKSRQQALMRQQQLTKPPGALGRLEQLAIDFGGFQKTNKPQLDNIAIRVFAADHGIASENISAFPQAVTAQMVHNFSAGGAAITVLARQHKADFSVVNLGRINPLPELPKLHNVQLAPGTANFCEQPAMTAKQMNRALEIGRDSCDPGIMSLFIGGEMGIGNTTSAAAIFCTLLDKPANEIIGRGTGIDDAGLTRKEHAICKALSLHSEAISTPEDVLRCLGGFEIAALVGAYIGNAQRGVPSLVDGYITTAAALLACRINPSVTPWLLYSHCSAESAHELILNAMNVKSLISLDMRLGEGSGAAVTLSLIQSALLLHSQMATFAEAGVSDG